MSEEILKALMQLFAIVSKQDTGSNESYREFVNSFLTMQINKAKVNDYLSLYDELSVKSDQDDSSGLTSVKDSVKVLAICRKINKTLTQKQKVVVLLRLYEFITSDNHLTAQRYQIIRTVSEVFKVDDREIKLIEGLALSNDADLDFLSEVLVINEVAKESNKNGNSIYAEGLDGEIKIIRIKSVGLFIMKYSGSSEIYLNGLPVNQNVAYIITHGATLRLPRGTVYYNEISRKINRETVVDDFVFTAQDIEYKFPNNKTALRDIFVSEKNGNLIGLMGASGAGKTTLLNVLSGIEKPSKGSVQINGIDIFKQKDKVKGLIGYISQDDLLLDDLTVYQNLYYNAKLCFRDYSEKKLHRIVMDTLGSLGLTEARDIKVGSPLNKKISGGQRKRLNIALELIREPSVLFVDEPTSGLSSKDSENVMDLLKELSQKGKLIFVVIHQPSSDIFKMFDKIILLDVGGYQIYYGNPVESLMHFKKATNQVNCDVGECESCGNVNPELLFNIIESKEIDEYGNYTEVRKFSPQQWNEGFKSNSKLSIEEVKSNKLKTIFQVPGLLKQLSVFIRRDVLAKTGNRQYLYLTLLEAPVLSVILSFIVRYTNDSGQYVFRENQNIPAYFFMSVVVALFLGLTISAEEIFKDQKILKREKFLNLSRMSYLLSKVIILLVISSVQSLLLVAIGNAIIGITGFYLSTWLMIFSVSFFANILGLNISSAFNSAVTIYIIIPLLIIPQLILGGAMFSYDKLNRYVGGGDRVPMVADAIAARWAYEGLITYQYTENNFNKVFFDLDKKISYVDFKLSYLIPELEKIVDNLNTESSEKNTQDASSLLKITKSELQSTGYFQKTSMMDAEQVLTQRDIVRMELQKAKDDYSEKLNTYTSEKEALISRLQSDSLMKAKYIHVKNSFSNDYLTDIVKNSFTSKKIKLKGKNGYRQIADPVFQSADPQFISSSVPFLIAEKYFFGLKIHTFFFNLGIIWIMSLIGFIALYFDLLKKVLSLF